jgi:hypothetical protein
MQVSTLIGLALACGGIAAWLWLPHETVLHAASSVLSPILVFVSDERFRRLASWVFDIGPKLFARLRRSAGHPEIPGNSNSYKFSNSSTQERVPMSLDLSSMVASLKADAEAAAKAAGEAALKAGLAALPAQAQPFASALVTVAENPSIATAIAQLESLAPAILALMAEAEASGVTKAIAAGTVTPAQVQ